MLSTPNNSPTHNHVLSHFTLMLFNLHYRINNNNNNNSITSAALTIAWPAIPSSILQKRAVWSWFCRSIVLYIYIFLFTWNNLHFLLLLLLNEFYTFDRLDLITFSFSKHCLIHYSLPKLKCFSRSSSSSNSNTRSSYSKWQ